MAEALALGGASWGMSIAGWVASPIISKLLNQGFSYLEMDVAARIETLEATILPQFQEVIDAAEKHGCKSNLEKWLRRLKDAMYEAEDALDFYKSHLLQQKICYMRWRFTGNKEYWSKIYQLFFFFNAIHVPESCLASN